MTHTPPIPAGNQSPYPIQEPPHEHVEAKLPAVVANDDDLPIVDRLRELPLLAVGAAVGLGAAVIGGVVFTLLREAPKPRRRRKTR